MPFFVPVNTGLICVSVDPLKCPFVYKDRAWRGFLHQAPAGHGSRQPLHTHTRKWNNKTCFPGKTRATMSSRMQGSLLKCRGVREWGGAHFVWLAGETPAPMHTRNADSWTGSLLHLQSRADLQGEAGEGSRCPRCTARCGAAGWEGIQDRQPVERKQWEAPGEQGRVWGSLWKHSHLFHFRAH